MPFFRPVDVPTCLAVVVGEKVEAESLGFVPVEMTRVVWFVCSWLNPCDISLAGMKLSMVAVEILINGLGNTLVHFVMGEIVLC
jgi:hypothetical protein